MCLCVSRVPFLVVGGLLIAGERTDTMDSAFFYGRAQVRLTPLSSSSCVHSFQLLFNSYSKTFNKEFLLNPRNINNTCCSLLQIISTAVVLAVSLVLGAVSLMGLSQGDREQRGYEALSRAAGMGPVEELRTPAGLEDPQQQTQMPNSPVGSINSGYCVLSVS